MNIRERLRNGSSTNESRNIILKPRQLGFTIGYKGEGAKDLLEKIKRMNKNPPRANYPMAAESSAQLKERKTLGVV